MVWSTADGLHGMSQLGLVMMWIFLALGCSHRLNVHAANTRFDPLARCHGFRGLRQFLGLTHQNSARRSAVRCARYFSASVSTTLHLAQYASSRSCRCSGVGLYGVGNSATASKLESRYYCYQRRRPLAAMSLRKCAPSNVMQSTAL